MTLFTFLSLVFQNLSEALTRVSVSLAQSENLYSKVGEGCKINKTLPMLVQKKTFTSARRWFSAYRKFQNFFYKKKANHTPLHSCHSKRVCNPPTTWHHQTDFSPARMPFCSQAWQGLLHQLPLGFNHSCSLKTAIFLVLPFLWPTYHFLYFGKRLDF